MLAYDPAAHVEQTEEVLAPCTEEYVPTGQALHAICPPMEVYCPAPHAGQTDTPTPPPSVPARQAEHAEALASEKSPLEQAWQALLDWAPAVPENLPAEQAVQVRLDTAPTTAEKVPEEHWTHWLLLVPPVPTR